MKHLIVCLSLLLHLVSHGQVTLIDQRDGRMYQTVALQDLNWMAEDLKYETSQSHCPNYNKSENECEFANFYSYMELENVCPTDWRLPSLEDWEKFIATLDQSKTARMMEKNKKIYRIDFLDRYNVFEHNQLGFKPIGRTEGNIRQDGQYVDYWTINKQLKDQRFHIHISPYTIVGHVHRHHVSGKKVSKNRKFAVRCVQDKN